MTEETQDSYMRREREAASKARYEWYRSAPGISSRAHDIVKWDERAERAEIARAAYYAARETAKAAYDSYVSAKRKRSCKGSILIANKLTAAASAYDAAASAYFAALDGAAAARVAEEI